MDDTTGNLKKSRRRGGVILYFLVPRNHRTVERRGHHRAEPTPSHLPAQTWRNGIHPPERRPPWGIRSHNIRMPLPPRTQRPWSAKTGRDQPSSGVPSNRPNDTTLVPRGPASTHTGECYPHPKTLPIKRPDSPPPGHDDKHKPRRNHRNTHGRLQGGPTILAGPSLPPDAYSMGTRS